MRDPSPSVAALRAWLSATAMLVVIPNRGPGEVVFDVIACGVCHTDLTYRDGGINDEFPFLLGHEAAGTVESVGPGVTTVDPGDFVILNWRAVCGQCRACKRGRPWYCFSTFDAEQPMTLTDCTELTPELGIGAFADKTLVHEGQCTKVDPAADAAITSVLCVAAWISRCRCPHSGDEGIVMALTTTWPTEARSSLVAAGASAAQSPNS